MSSFISAPIATGPLTSIPSSSVSWGLFPSSTPSIVSSSAAPSPSASSSLQGFPPANSPFFSESRELLWIEETINAAGYLAAIAWGLYLGIFYKAVVNILKSKNRTNMMWLPFTGALFAAATTSMVCYADYNQQAWIDEGRSYPGGPLYWLEERTFIPVYVAATAASLITQTLSQAFLTYRIHALYDMYWLTILSGAWVLATFGLGVAFTTSVANGRFQWFPGTNDDPIAKAGVFLDLGMAFNIVVTAFLLWRVLYLRPKVPTSFPEHIRSKFVRVDAILVESVLLLGIISLVYVSLLGSTGSRLFFPFIVQLEAIFSTLIVIRIVQGWGWDAGVIHRTPTDYQHSWARGAHLDDHSDSASHVKVKAAV